MKKMVCKTQFESMHEKIKEVFSTSFILKCQNINNMTIYSDVFLDDEVSKLLKNEDIIKTAKIFFENDLNLSKASKKYFLHRNTMIYRIDKIKNVTGLDIRKFDDSVRFFNMIEIYESVSF